MNQVYIITMLALVGFALTAQTAFATRVAVTVLNNGTLVGNKLPALPWSNATENLTDPPNGPTETYQIIFYPDKSFDKHHSSAWKAGYTQGFLGVNLGGKGHTQAFFQGYTNGSKRFWWVKGYAYGISGKQGGAPNEGYDYGDYDSSYNVKKQFHWGNDTGAKDRIDVLDWYSHSDGYGPGSYQLSPLPVNTTDHYMHYYVGFENGYRAQDNGTEAITTTDNGGYYDSGCLPKPHYVDGYYVHGKWVNGHDVASEYCTGFKAGWNRNVIENNED